jgi:hypothetical protein
VPSQVEQHGQPRRTPSRLGFQEPKSNKHKPSQLGGESSAQDVKRSFPLLNLSSMHRSCKGFDLRTKRKRERVSQCLGAVCLKVGGSKCCGQRLEMKGRAIYTLIFEVVPVLPVSTHRYYRSKRIRPLQSTYWRLCEKIAYRYYRSFTGTTGQRPVPPVVQFFAKTCFARKRLTGTTELSPVPLVNGWYYRSTTDTTARAKTRKTKALTPAGFMPTGTTGGSPVPPVLPGIKHFSKCP